MRVILYYCVSLFIIGPIFEWFVHFVLHKINNAYHKSHHINYYKDNIAVETIPAMIIPILIYFNCYILLLLDLRYYIVHTIIHKKPDIFNGLFMCYANHHNIHHKNPTCNFGVSSIWVDKLFNTYKR